MANFNFYQEPLDKNDPLYEAPKFTKRGDPIGNEVMFESVEQVAPNTYNLTLGLDTEEMY